MAFDGLTMYKIVNELKDYIISGKVDKIYEPNSNEILLGIYHNGSKYALDIVTSPSNYRLCLTTNAKPNPTNAPNFCMLLRKYLLNPQIANIYTFDLERIAILEFEGHNKSGDFTPKKLVIELMGKHSNVILLNSNDVIIDALKHFDTNSNSYRNILPGYSYYFPTSDKFNFVDQNSFEEFYQKLSEKNFLETDLLSLAISETYIGLGRSSIQHYIRALKIKDIFTRSNSEKLYTYLRELINSDVVCISHDSSEYNLELFNNEDNNSIVGINNHSSLPSLNFFIDDYYSNKEASEYYLNYRNQFSKLLLQHLKRLTIKLDTINSKLKECENTNIYKLYGELITSNLYKLGTIHTNKISLENYYDNNKVIEIPLDKSITPNENAKKYFKKYHKLKNAQLIVEKQKNEVEQEISYLESVIYTLQLATSINDIDEIYHEFMENINEEYIGSKNKFNNKKNFKSKNSKESHKKSSKKEKNKSKHIGDPIKYIIDSFQVLVGKNNIQNDYITKHASSDDIWLHTKDIHGSHVILKTNSRVPSQEIINKCASIAAAHSKASGSDNVPVDYTYIKYVKKPSNSKPGMVIYNNHKTVIVKPDSNINKLSN